MITELSIEGFKSFGSPAETIALGPLNFVVGANASGKSNLLGALRFLQNAVAHDVSYAVSEMGGNAEVRNKRLRQRRQAKPVRLSLKIEKNFRFTSSEDSEKEDHGYVVRSFEYSIVLDLRSDDTTPRIETESLRAQFVRDGESTTVGLERNEDTVWRFHNFVPRVARQPYRDEPDATLGPAGEKLATILHRMSTDDRTSIAQGLRAIVPGLKDVKTTKLPIEDTLAFQIVEDKLKAAINPASVSDGTVRSSGWRRAGCTATSTLRLAAASTTSATTST